MSDKFSATDWKNAVEKDLAEIKKAVYEIYVLLICLNNGVDYHLIRRLKMPTKTTTILKEVNLEKPKENQVKSFIDKLENRINELELSVDELSTKLKLVAGRLGL